MPSLSARPTIVGPGNSFVVSLPTDFNIQATLEQAKSIRLATAFAHQNGWHYLKPGMSHAKGEIFLLTGFDFCQTEPRLLREWHRLSLRGNTRARIATTGVVFHPKILIVRGPASGQDFAIVGSGNLSKGGIYSNVECSLYTDEQQQIDTLTDWFDEIFEAGTSLTPETILRYEKHYKKARQHAQRLSIEQNHAESDVRRLAKVWLQSWNEAVLAAKDYLRSPKSRGDIRSRVRARPEILKALRHPQYDFDKGAFAHFYSMKDLGALDPRYRDTVFAQEAKLKRALRSLSAESPGSNMEQTLSSILNRDGDLHVRGMGLNTISKILACTNPTRWPVYNSRVESVLKRFGYETSGALSASARYIAYADLMLRFMRACGARNVLELDAFFYDYSHKVWKQS
jgi:HKD family nuclease